MGREDWFNPSAYLWGDWGHAGTPLSYTPQQQWYRDPQWGGHIVYNPNWGWQDYGKLEEFYGGQQGPLAGKDFSKAFKGAGFQKQMGFDWRQYFPDRPVVGPDKKPQQPQQPYGSSPWGGGGGFWGGYPMFGGGWNMPYWGGWGGQTQGGQGMPEQGGTTTPGPYSGMAYPPWKFNMYGMYGSPWGGYGNQGYGGGYGVGAGWRMT